MSDKVKRKYVKHDHEERVMAIIAVEEFNIFVANSPFLDFFHIFALR